MKDPRAPKPQQYDGTISEINVKLGIMINLFFGKAVAKGSGC